MAEKVGEIYYDVTLETGRMIEAQREIDRRSRETAASLESMGGGAKAAEQGFRSAGTAAQEAGGRFRDAAGRLREANGQFVGTKSAAAGAAGGFGQAASAADVLMTNLTQVAVAVKVYAAAMAIVNAAQMADDMRLLAARVEVAAGSMQAGAEAMRDLEGISRRTQTSMADNVDVFARLNQSMIQMGGTQADTLQLTELLGKAIKVSGASAVEAKAAMLQFGQALGSGKLGGDELRSLMENAPYLMRQLADGIGVPVGALKNLGSEGKLTADVVVNALGKAAGKIDQDFQKFPQTIGSAMAVTEDAAKRAAEKLDDMTGTSAVLAGATKGLGSVLDKLAEQFSAGTTEADKLGRSPLVKTWAENTATVLTYVVDAADFVTRGFKQMGVGLGGLAAAAGAAASGELTQARDVLGMMADDIKNIGNAKFSGAKMREQFQFAKDFVGPQAPADLGYKPSKLKPPEKSDEEKKKEANKAKKLATQALAAQEYYDGLVASNKTALEKIDAEEQKALTENQKRRVADGGNAAVYEAAKAEIHRKFTRERSQLEEKTTQEVADLKIQLTTDADAKIGAILSEEVRRADAAAKLGTMTHEQAERAKTLATHNATQQRAALAERVAQTTAETAIESTANELTKIDLIRQENIRRADAAEKAGTITHAQAEADKARATVQAQNAIRQQVMSINPMATLKQEYEQKLAIVSYYEQQMAQAGVDATAFAEAKRNELKTQYQQQRQALAESEFALQDKGNKLVMDGLNAMASSASSSIVGLISGTMTAQDAMRGLASTVLNEAVGALVQMGVQYLKNSIIAQAASSATTAAQTAAIATTTAAQVAATGTMAATSVAASGTVAAAAAPAAGLMSVATLGEAALIGGAALIGTMALAKSFGGGRQYGGPVSADKLYRVNEKGAPEMFTAANGSQYMMPTTNGKVTAADKMGGGSPVVNVVVNNTAPGTMATATYNDQSRTVSIAVTEVANQIRTNTGPVWSAMRGATNVQARM
jgi:tape measure domain-containing protein